MAVESVLDDVKASIKEAVERNLDAIVTDDPVVIDISHHSLVLTHVDNRKVTPAYIKQIHLYGEHTVLITEFNEKYKVTLNFFTKSQPILSSITVNTVVTYGDI